MRHGHQHINGGQHRHRKHRCSVCGSEQHALHGLDVHKTLRKRHQHKQKRIETTFKQDMIRIQTESIHLHLQIRRAVPAHQAPRSVEEQSALRIPRDFRVHRRTQRQKVHVQLVQAPRDRRLRVSVRAAQIQPVRSVRRVADGGGVVRRDEHVGGGWRGKPLEKEVHAVRARKQR